MYYHKQVMKITSPNKDRKKIAKSLIGAAPSKEDYEKVKKNKLKEL